MYKSRKSADRAALDVEEAGISWPALFRFLARKHRGRLREMGFERRRFNWNIRLAQNQSYCFVAQRRLSKEMPIGEIIVVGANAVVTESFELFHHFEMPEGEVEEW